MPGPELSKVILHRQLLTLNVRNISKAQQQRAAQMEGINGQRQCSVTRVREKWLIEKSEEHNIDCLTSRILLQR